jgi:AcrR family transcriptional regulator
MKTYHHGDLRQSLIDGAIELLAEKDVSSFSLREVARRVGVSHTSPYRHFEDKEALLAAVAEEGFLELTELMRIASDRSSSDSLEKLEAIGVAYVKFGVDRPTHYRVMFGSRKEQQTEYPSLAKAANIAFSILEGAIARGQIKGAIRSGYTQQLAWVAWSLVHGLVMLLINGQLPIFKSEDVEMLASLVTRTLVEGLVEIGDRR